MLISSETSFKRCENDFQKEITFFSLFLFQKSTLCSSFPIHKQSIVLWKKKRKVSTFMESICQ